MTSQQTSTGTDRALSFIPQQITVDHSHCISPAQRWRWRNLLSERDLHLQALASSNCEEARLERGRSCASDLYVEHNELLGKKRIVGNYCNHRLCPLCSISHRASLFRRMEAWFKGRRSKRVRLITLTLQHSPVSLRVQLKHLKASFRRLRQTKLWQSCVESGRAIVEVTWNAKTSCWHPHLHVVATGTYLPQDELANQWAGSSGGSYVVDVRPVKAGHRASKYLAKYLGKPPKISEPKQASFVLSQYYNAVDGLKMHWGFGTDSALPDDPNDIEDAQTAAGWVLVGSLNDILDLASKGDDNAKAIVNKLERTIQLDPG